MVLAITLLAVFSIWAIANWIVWKVNAQAILLFHLESGGSDIDSELIKKYRGKVIKKHFKVN